MSSTKKNHMFTVMLRNEGTVPQIIHIFVESGASIKTYPGSKVFSVENKDGNEIFYAPLDKVIYAYINELMEV